MADRARIADLWGGYGAGNDLRDFDLLESCFTEDMSFTVHRQAGEEYGTSGSQQLVLLRDGWVADNLEEVERVWWPCIRAEHWFYFKQIPRWVADREPFLAGVREESDFRFDTHRIDRLVAGSPEDCIAAIEKFRDTLHMDYLIMSFRMAAGPAHEAELACIRRFGRDVIPAFR